MAVDRRVRLLDRAAGWTGARISSATTAAEVARLRERRAAAVGPPALRPLLRVGERALFGAPRADVTTEDRTLPGAGGPLPFRLYRPPTVHQRSPLLVHLHGGGWVLGDLDGADAVCSHLAAETDVLVASVDYRLAPEHPAPAGVDDAHAAFAWFAEHGAELGAGGPLAVSGDSAGGNLAALVALRARDEQVPLAAQVLVYPAVDLTRSFPSHRTLADAPLLSAAEVDAFLRWYLPAGTDPADPTLSPWFVDDLAGVAPALVQTASDDPLRDEGEAYAARLVEAGVEVRTTRYADAPHGYLSVPGVCPAARQARAEIVQFLRPRLHGG